MALELVFECPGTISPAAGSTSGVTGSKREKSVRGCNQIGDKLADLCVVVVEITSIVLEFEAPLERIRLITTF